jgi:hypothetical protein
LRCAAEQSRANGAQSPWVLPRRHEYWRMTVSLTAVSHHIGAAGMTMWPAFEQR